MILILFEYGVLVDDGVGIVLFVCEVAGEGQFDFAYELGGVVVGVVDGHGECAKEGVLLFVSGVLDAYEIIVFELAVEQFELFLHVFYY